MDGYQTYHVMNPYDDGIGLDEYVDWLIDAGYSIQRVGDYGTWLQRFETTLRPCPIGSVSTRCCRCCTTTRSRRRRSTGRWHRPTDSAPRCKRRKSAPTKTFRMSREPVIVKYITDLQLLGLL